MIKMKLCLLGTLSVGKTSLVRRYVDSVYSNAYQTTIGVKIDKKQVTVGDSDVDLVIWDMEGVDEYQSLRKSYLRGAAGYLLIADGTRRESFERALEIHREVAGILPDVPWTLVLNKVDLQSLWMIDEGDLEGADKCGWTTVLTSAKNGDNVESTFAGLAARMIESGNKS